MEVNKLTINKMLRCEDEVWKEFTEIANKEGRFLGKMLEKLIETFKESKEQSHGQSTDNKTIG